jgi:hypothetical protein
MWPDIIQSKSLRIHQRADERVATICKWSQRELMEAKETVPYLGPEQGHLQPTEVGVERCCMYDVWRIGWAGIKGVRGNVKDLGG